MQRLEWSPAQVAVCAARRDQILDCAAAMVRPGGRILYSTCTFPRRKKRTDSGPVSGASPGILPGEAPCCRIFFSEGRPEWAESVGSKEQRDELRKTVRIWPYETGGEGHFMALFVKNGDGAGDSGGMEPTADRRTEGRKGRRKRRTREPEKDQGELMEAARFLKGERAGAGPSPGWKAVPHLWGQRIPGPGGNAGAYKDPGAPAGTPGGDLKKAVWNRPMPWPCFLKKGRRLPVGRAWDGETAAKYLRGEAIGAGELEAVSGGI